MSEGIKVYKTFMNGIRIYNNGELISKVPYTKNGTKFIDEISNLTAVEIIDNVRHGGLPKASESGLDLHGVSGSSYELIEQLLQNHLKAAGKLTRCDLDEQSEHELGLSIGRTKLAIKEFKNYR